MPQFLAAGAGAAGAGAGGAGAGMAGAGAAGAGAGGGGLGGLLGGLFGKLQGRAKKNKEEGKAATSLFPSGAIETNVQQGPQAQAPAFARIQAPEVGPPQSDLSSIIQALLGGGSL